MSFFQILFEPANLKVILNIAFFALLALVLLAGVLSMWRKVLPFAWHTVFFLILFILGIFLAKPIGNALGNFDLSRFGDEIVVNGTSVPLTKTIETVENIIHTVVSNDKDSIIYIAVTNKELAELIHSMATMICRYLAFLLWSICSVTFGGLIALLLYHAALKWAFPKKVRKWKKRWVAFLIGIVNSSIIATMLLMPITAIVNTVNAGVRKSPSAEIVDQESYDQILGWADAYDSSIFAKVLFGIQDSDGRSLDVMIMDYATKTDYQGDELIFSQQIGEIANMAENLIAAGIFENGTAISTSTLISKSVVSAFLTSIIDSEFMLKLLPTLLQVVLTYADQQELIDKKYIDLADISWSEELEIIDEIYASLYDTGIIGDLADGENFSIPVDDESYKKIHDALLAINDSKLMNRLFPAIIYYYVNHDGSNGKPSTLSRYLPSNWEDYKGIHWGSELLAFYDTIFQLNKKGIDLLNLLMPKESKGLQTYTFKNGFLPNIRPTEQATEQSSLLQVFIDRFEDVVGILTGYNGNGQIITDSPYSILFDSELLVRSIDKVLTSVIHDALKEQNDTLISEEDLQNGLNQLNTKADYQYEAYNLLRFISILLGNENIQLESGTIDIQNASVRASLIEASPCMDESKILAAILPGMFESLLKDLSFGENIPLSGKDLNFRNIRFSEELPLLLNGFDEVMNISDALKGGSANDIISQLDPTSLENVLNLLYDSQIINPKDKKNQNFYLVLDQIFNNETFKQMGLSKKISYDSIKNWHAENAAIAHIFATIKNEDMVSILTQNQEAQLTDFNADSIKKLFASIDDSQLIRATFGDVLDHLLRSSISTEITDISFNNVTNWTEEGIHLSYAIQSFQSLNTTIQDMDWINSDPSLTEPLLKELAALQLFQNGDKNYFGHYMWEDLKRDDILQVYLQDYPSNANSYTMSEGDFDSISSWKEDGGEVDHIIAVIQSFQSIYEDEFGPIVWDENTMIQPGSYGLEIITNGQASSSQLWTVLDALTDAPSLRMMTINAVDEAINNMSFSDLSIDFSTAQVAFLLDLPQKDRKAELLLLPTLYEAIENLWDEENRLATSAVEILLRTGHQSRIFNSGDNPDFRTNLTVFEQMVTEIALQAHLGESISGSTDELKQKEAIQQLVLSIPNGLGDETKEDGWEGNSGEITKIVRVLKLYEDAGMHDFTTQSLLSLSKTSFVELLQSVNQSIILHPAIVDFFQKAIQSMGMDSLLTLDTPDYKLTRLKEEEKIAQYDQEIVLFANLIEEAKLGTRADGTIEMFEFNASNAENGDLTRFVTPVEEGGYGKHTAPFMHLLKDSLIMRPVRSEMLYEMISQLGTDSYIRPLTGTKEQKIAKIETFFAPTQMSDGTWIDYRMDADVEGNGLDLVLPLFTNEMKNITSLDDIVSQSDTVYKAILATTGLDAHGNEKRAYFTSELVAGYLTKYGPTGDNFIAWVVEKDNACDDFSKLGNSSASQIKDILEIKAEYQKLVELQADLDVGSNEAQAFIQAMSRLDFYATDPENYDVANKLTNALISSCIDEQTIEYENMTMTLKEAFDYVQADTYAKKAEFMVKVASQLQ